MPNLLIFVVVGLHLIIVTIMCRRNNVCPTFQDYYNKEFNPRCWYDPDVFSDAIDLLKRYKYNYEVHTAITPDGYILNVYRLPPKGTKPKGLVYFSNSAVSDMIVWMDKGKHSIAFMLVEAGYDVWIGNYRGSHYSLNHVTLSRTHQANQYFNYSFHELGIYDTPTQLELVRNVSGSSSKIYFVGHSLGATIAFIYASLLPQHAKEYIHVFILWAPAAFLNFENSSFKILIPFFETAVKIVKFFNLTNFASYNNINLVAYYLCFEFPRISKTCNTLLDSVFGLDPENVSPELFPSLLFHGIYSFSLKIAQHYIQLENTGRFQTFDDNLPQPHEYPLENILTPMHFFYGTRDTIAPPAENVRLYNRLRPEMRHGMTEVGYNHINSMYGKNLYENLYVPTMNIIENFLNKI